MDGILRFQYEIENIYVDVVKYVEVKDRDRKRVETEFRNVVRITIE